MNEQTKAYARLDAVAEGTVRDRLWLFACPTNSDYGYLGRRSVMTPAEGAFYFGVPNIIMVQCKGRFPYGKFESPLGQYAVPLRSLKRIVWSVVGSGGYSSEEETEEVLQMAAENPRLVGLMLDDFFTGNIDDGFAADRKGRKARLALDELQEIRQRFLAASENGEIFATLYNRHLGLERELEEYMELIDVLIFWSGSKNVYKLESKLENARRLYPKKKLMLGCYMHLFFDRQPLPVEDMKLQCQVGLRWLQEGRIEGIIFIANTLMDLDLEAVDWTRDWIREIGETAL